MNYDIAGIFHSFGILFARLSRVATSDLRSQPDLSCVPGSYWEFLELFGTGGLDGKAEGGFFFFYDHLTDAATEYFWDDEVYSDGNKQPIYLFGYHTNGLAYGFRAGAHNKVVRVDSDRVPEVLDLTFDQFLVGIAVCYPFMPFRFTDGSWFSEIGQRFDL